ncbi:hypothetical protein CP97_14624 [Aurantiacibacter atlanticus]|uniref:Uncharacterized protein n=1 Tax=Aurantiacibacter atlanticus TaxID=1648404 RepID=A0A161IU04_9SPHN|nr:hypothetical protein [Aurantiacibacter atlanticus]ANC50310.1 hypothetical protein CP97_14624 [Aurantiacibacter atlanticus]
MITTSSRSDSGLIARLASQATKLAMAHAENRLRIRNGDSAHWRDARLLWPLFSRND